MNPNYHFGAASKKRNVPPHKDLLTFRAENAKLTEENSYASYLYSFVKNSSSLPLVRYYYGFFRDFSKVARLFRIFSYLFYLAQLGTTVVFTFLILTILIPLLLICALICIFFSSMLYYRENQKMKRRLSGKSVYILFPSRGGEFSPDSFWMKNCLELSQKENAAVLIVSPFFWSSRGCQKGRFYLLSRKENESVFMLRKHYFFSLKRNILQKHIHDLTAIY